MTPIIQHLQAFANTIYDYRHNSYFDINKGLNMRLAILCLIGAAVFAFPCAWDSDPHLIPPAAAFFAKLSATAQSPSFHFPPSMH